LISVFSVTLVSAQPAGNREPSKEDLDNFMAKKVAFFTEKLQLTPAEAQVFWPIYNQSEKESWEAQRKRREIEMKVQMETRNLSDKEIIDLTKQMVETYKAEAMVTEKYNKKFLEILPPKKVLKLYQAENQFRMSMLHEYRNRRPGQN
jgi:Spy/CpxP family protein refolding chaperone